TEEEEVIDDGLGAEKYEKGGGFVCWWGEHMSKTGPDRKPKCSILPDRGSGLGVSICLRPDRTEERNVLYCRIADRTETVRSGSGQSSVRAHDKEITRADVSVSDWSANDWSASEGTRILYADQSEADTSALVPYHVPLGHMLPLAGSDCICNFPLEKQPLSILVVPVLISYRHPY
nr:hypothetical protein [Tanacetum cinerariifolium]